MRDTRTKGEGASSPASGNPVSSSTGCHEFDYAPGQPNLYRVMRFKQAIVAEFGVQAGFNRYRDKFGLSRTVVLQSLPIRGEREFSAEHALVFKESGRSGEVFLHEPPLVIGQGNHRPVHGVTRSEYVAMLADARVRGRSAAVAVEGALLLDFQGDEQARLDDELDWDAAIFHAENGIAWQIGAAADDVELVVDEAFSLLGAHTDFFGHWMCEYLPKLVSAALSGVLGARKLLIDAHMPPSHRQSLEFLYPGQFDLVEIPAYRSVFVRRLWVAPTPSYMPLHEKRNERFNWDAISASPQRLAPIVREMCRRADLSLPMESEPRGKVFLARRSFRHRKLVNSELIEAEAKARGFQIVYPEDLPFAAQVSLLRGARHIIALEGSAIFLCLFASAGSRLCILSHPLTDALADFHEMFRVHGAQRVVLTGPIIVFNDQTPHDSDYEIAPDLLNRFLDDWLSKG